MHAAIAKQRAAYVARLDRKATARSAAARKAWDTRRARGNVAEPVDVRAGRKADYTKLSTPTLLAFLPDEQWYIDSFVGGQHVHFARERLDAIERELRGRGLDEETLIAYRFGVADADGADVDAAERFAIEREADSYFAGHIHFSPEEFAA